MDPTAFDALVRAFATGGTRRRLLRLVAALPLGGALRAMRMRREPNGPMERLGRRTQQRNRQQRNRQRRNQNNKQHQHDKHHQNNQHHQHDNNGGGGGGGNPGPCTPNGQACTRRQCCSRTASTSSVRRRSHLRPGSAATPCTPAAVGCCPVDGCCQPPANQCNNAGLCCAPNCAGRECGPDGCGNPGGHLRQLWQRADVRRGERAVSGAAHLLAADLPRLLRRRREVPARDQEQPAARAACPA